MEFGLGRRACIVPLGDFISYVKLNRKTVGKPFSIVNKYVTNKKN